MKYDVFISYSRKDREITDQICDVLKENGITYFIDTEDISGGEEFSPVLAENIESCTLFLFIGSKNSYGSKWTPKELHFALNHKESIAIIPYLIDEEPLPQKIEFAIADLNVRNIKEHPIDTILIEDIKTAKDKINIRSGKEDLKMAKAIADSIVSCKHDRDYCFDFLNRLGDINFKRGTGYIYPNETLQYFISALTLYENEEIINDRNNIQNNRIASTCSKIANIYYSQEKYDDAAIYLEKAITKYRLSEDSMRRSENLCDNLLWLCEIKIMKEDYVKAEQLCTDVKEELVNKASNWGIDRKVLRMTELLVKTLRAQQKYEQAEKAQDEILDLFKIRQDPKSFIDMLTTFADANIKAKQFNYAEKYIRDAYVLDKENIMLVIKFAEILEQNQKIDDAKNKYEEAFRLAMSPAFGGKRSREFLQLHKQIVSFFDRNGFSEEIDKYFKLAISKYSIDIYRGDIGKTTIGSIYERYADWLTKQQHYYRSIRYLKKCNELTLEMTNQDSITRIQYNTLTKKVINEFCLTNKEGALSDLTKALDIFENSNGVIPISGFEDLFINFNKIGFTEGTELIKKRMINYHKGIKIDDLRTKGRYLTSYGWIMLLMEEYENARQPLEDALKLELKVKNEFGIYNAKNNLGRLYVYTEKYDKAEEFLNDALHYYEKLSAKDDTALHNYAESQNYMGRLRMKQKRYEEAEIFFELSLDNYKKAALIDNLWEKYIKETTILLEQVKALQEE